MLPGTRDHTLLDPFPQPDRVCNFTRSFDSGIAFPLGVFKRVPVTAQYTIELNKSASFSPLLGSQDRWSIHLTLSEPGALPHLVCLSALRASSGEIGKFNRADCVLGRDTNGPNPLRSLLTLLLYFVGVMRQRAAPERRFVTFKLLISLFCCCLTCR